MVGNGALSIVDFGVVLKSDQLVYLLIILTNNTQLLYAVVLSQDETRLDFDILVFNLEKKVKTSSRSVCMVWLEA